MKDFPFNSRVRDGSNTNTAASEHEHVNNGEKYSSMRKHFDESLDNFSTEVRSRMGSCLQLSSATIDKKYSPLQNTLGKDRKFV